MRTNFIAAGRVDAHHLSPFEVGQIFKSYMERIKSTLRPEQRNRTHQYHKSITEAALKREAGAVNIAKLIWAIGLPDLPILATEQLVARSDSDHMADLHESIRNILQWLDRLASTLLQHRSTPAHQEARRKAGVAHGESGLTAAEQRGRQDRKQVGNTYRLFKKEGRLL